MDSSRYWQVSRLVHRPKCFVTFGGFTPPFNGVVDVFDADGRLLTPNHFAANSPGAGPLVNPWGIVRTPAHFGNFSNALLIGNVEDGKINAFNPDTEAFLGPLTDSNNNAIVISGLWDLSFGNGRNNGRANQLFFDAGPNAPNFSGKRVVRRNPPGGRSRRQRLRPFTRSLQPKRNRSWRRSGTQRRTGQMGF